MTMNAKPKSGIFNALARKAALFGALLGASALSACGPMPEDEVIETRESELQIGFGTPFGNYVPANGPVVWAQQSMVMPWLPTNPSAFSSLKEVFFVQNGGMGCNFNQVYFKVRRQGTLAAGGDKYAVETTTETNCAHMDGSLSQTAYPGDTVTWTYNQTGSGGVPPYIQISNNNASGKGAVYNISKTFILEAGTPAMNFYLVPNVAWGVDTSSGHNCAGDMPGTDSGKIAEMQINARMLVNGANVNALVLPPTGTPNANLSPAGCGLSVSSFQSGGLTYSNVKTYGTPHH